MPNPSPRGGWKQSTGGATGASPGVRRTIALVALLAAAGGVAGLWFWIQPPLPVRFVNVPVAQYTDPVWPPNPWAEHDSSALVTLFPSGAESAFTFQERHRFESLLKSLEGESKRPVVLYITALGATHDGAVYILPGLAQPAEVRTWYPLAELLDGFERCQSSQKLLIIDIAVSLADPFRGPLIDDVAERLHTVLSKTPPSYFVLTSCSAGETAQSMDAAQATAFGYYVAEGLRGAADGYDSGGTRDGRVSVRDLAAFTAARVHRWTSKCAPAAQTPMLYGTTAHFALMFAQRESPESPAPRTYPVWLTEAWQARDTRREAGAYRVVPSIFIAAEAAILRAERAWIAGGEKAAQLRLDAERNELRVRVDAEKPTRPVSIRSVVAAQGSKPIPPDLAVALESLLAVKAAVPPAKPEELQKATEAFATKAKADRTAAAATIWAHLVRDPEPTPERLKTLTDLLVETQPSPSTESLLARRCAAWQPRSIPWPGTAIHSLLLAEDALSHALTLAPAAFPWIDKLIAAAAAAQREGEAMLFDSKTLADVQVAVQRLTGAERDLRAVRRQWEIVQLSQRATDDDAYMLLGSVESAIDGAIPEAIWRAAIDAACALADTVDRTPDGTGLPLAEWETRLQSSRRARVPLTTPWTADAMKRTVATGTPADLRQLLRGPLAGANDRAASWAALAKQVQKLHDEVIALDRADDESGKPTPVPRASAASSAETERAARRKRISADLLRLAGLPGDANPEAWLVRLPKARAEKMAKQDWAGASRLDRLAIFGDDRGGRPPAARELRADEQQCRQWLAEWYTALGRLRASVPGATEFCDAAAADVRQPPRD